MSRFLCDSGVWLAAANPHPDEPFHEGSRRLLTALADNGEEIGALDLTLYEVANVATRRWRSPATALGLVEFVRDGAASSLVRWDIDMFEAATALAGDHDLSVYDAAYAATSQALGWTLVSTDMRDLVRPGFAITPDQVVV